MSRLWPPRPTPHEKRWQPAGPPHAAPALDDVDRARRFAGNTTLLDFKAAIQIRNKDDLLRFYTACLQAQNTVQSSVSLQNQVETPDLFGSNQDCGTDDSYNRPVSARVCAPEF
jgi:hypothetical protein